MTGDGQATRIARCGCGALTVTTRGEPVHVYVCSCEACQRRSGSALTWGAVFPEDAVEIAGPRRSWRHSADTGRWIETSFCPTCGVTAYYHAEVLPRLVAVPVGCFADPGFPAPKEHFFASRQQSWLGLPADIPHHATQPG